MRLRHIEVFHAVYTCGTVTAASKFLQVSQPSVSKVLAHAEQQLGYALFDRVKGKLVPTLEAERLIGNVSSVYQSIDELQRVSRNIGASDIGRIRLLVTPAFGIDFIPSVIAGYLEQHPDTEFDVETQHYEQAIRALNQSRIDLAIVFHPASEPGIKADHLATGQFVALAGSGVDIGNGQSVHLSDLRKFPFIKLSDRGPLGQLLTKHLEASDVQLKSSVKVETYQMAKALVAHGAGVTIVDEITARSSGHRNVQFKKLNPELNFNITLLTLESTPLSIVSQRFVSHLKPRLQSFLKQPLFLKP
ncbi:MAG: DNA-binding transcriptional LysR family regulator [Lysobacterales bacterium]|jgi:DNA-binding transcriptional LysR family regulator